ncbi:MAG: hypothetical protein ACI841_002837 [Planctomycetota bacterium]|jgi:hypothetical protein
MKPQLAAVCLTLFLASDSLLADVVSIEASSDNTLYEEPDGLLSNGAGDYLFSGITGEGNIRRALIYFDLSAHIPTGATILAATLRMNMSQSIADDVQVDVHRATADWGQGSSHASGQEGGGADSETGDATWIHRHYPSDSWANAGGDFIATASASAVVHFVGGYSWNSTQMIVDSQEMLDQPGTNHGWLMKHQDELTNFTAKRFDSSENTTPLNRPTLVVEFDRSPACGSSSYCSSDPNSTGVAAVISFQGSCQIADDDFTLTAAPVPDQPGIFFYSLGQTAGGSGLPFGNGTRCVGNSSSESFRLSVVFANAGTLVLPVALNMPPSPAGQISAGSTWNFQAWFRDPVAGGAAFDFSDALQVMFS